MDEDLDSGAAGMTEESASSGPSSAKKRRKSAPVPPDEFVGDRIKQLKTTITGLKTEDNAWTQTLRDKLDPDTVKGKLGGDRSFKTNQQWVAATHGGSKEAAPKWSWYGALFMLVPFGLLSGKQEQYPSVWVCACTKGCRKPCSSSAEQGHDGSCVVLGQPCVCGARLLGSHGAGVSAIVAGVD